MEKITFTGALFSFNQGSDKWTVVWKEDPTDKKFPWIAYVDKNGVYVGKWYVRQAPTRSSSLLRIRQSINENSTRPTSNV